MTNPKLFSECAIVDYQRHSELSYAQGKKVGSCFDGMLKPHLGQLQDTGPDAIESTSPMPLTQCAFDEL
jgi:hypothetical protein